MGYIPDSELASIRADLAAVACDKSCQIWRPTVTRGASGQEAKAYTLLYTVMAGMGEPSAGDLQNYDYEIADKAAWKLRFPYGTDIQHWDHAVIDGETLEVHILLTPRSFEGLLSVIAAELK